MVSEYWICQSGFQMVWCQKWTDIVHKSCKRDPCVRYSNGLDVHVFGQTIQNPDTKLSLLGSYTPVLVPHSLFKLTNMKVKVSKPTNMNLNQTHEHECCNTAEHNLIGFLEKQDLNTVVKICKAVCGLHPVVFQIQTILY